MDLLRRVWPAIWCQKLVSERQIVASQLELVELDCGWGPHDRTSNCDRCAYAWVTSHSNCHSLRQHMITPCVCTIAALEPHSAFQNADRKTQTLLARTLYSADRARWTPMSNLVGCYTRQKQGDNHCTGTLVTSRVKLR